MMEEIAGWVAPVTTMIAAMMTAANLGPRVTGWGFVIFTIGSIAWSTVAIATGQSNLLWANGFLTLVNLVGIWRWLGRLAKYDEGAKEAQKRSVSQATTLFSVASLIDRPVVNFKGTTIARAIGAMASCDGGGIAYLVVAEGGVGGVGERLHAVAWQDVTLRDEALAVSLDAAAVAALPEVDPKDWPAASPAPRRAA